MLGSRILGSPSTLLRGGKLEVLIDDWSQMIEGTLADDPRKFYTTMIQGSPGRLPSRRRSYTVTAPGLSGAATASGADGLHAVERGAGGVLGY